jgi:hypothetical protein
VYLCKHPGVPDWGTDGAWARFQLRAGQLTTRAVSVSDTSPLSIDAFFRFFLLQRIIRSIFSTE